VVQVEYDDSRETQIDRKSFILSGVKFLVMYLLFIIPLTCIFVFLSIIPETVLWLDEISLCFLEVTYLSMSVISLIVWGVMNADDERRPLRHCKTVLPMVIIGVAIWLISWKNSGGLLGSEGTRSWFWYDDYKKGADSWFLYSIYHMWVMPFIDYLKMSKFVSGKAVFAIGLVASFVPGVSYLGGVWLCGHYATTARKKVISILMMIPSLLLIGFVISTVFPRDHIFTIATYPRIDGSTVAMPFGENLARELMGMNAWQAQKQSRYNKTHQAYLNLINQKVDLIFVVDPSEAEMKLATEKGVRLQLIPIGKDAFVFLVHRESLIDNLTITQIQDIYSGKINNWQQVGGPNGPIVPYQRDENSGSQTFMERKVMKEKKKSQVDMEKIPPFMSGLIDVIADRRNAQKAIGYSFYYYANDMRRSEEIKFLSIEGVECNKENIKNDVYPFSAVIYAVIRADEPIDSPAAKLVNWLSTEKGKKTIEKSGFIPIEKNEMISIQ